VGWHGEEERAYSVVDPAGPRAREKAADSTVLDEACVYVTRWGVEAFRYA
jgi:hypothetical protein